MGMTAFYGSFDRSESEAESLRTIARALSLGINFLDTAWIYQVPMEDHFVCDCLKCLDSHSELAEETSPTRS